jgi:U3 small nucleolar RNA-associated protein 13
VATLSGHTEAVHAVAWSQSGSNFVVSGSKDKTVKLWDTKFLAASSGTTSGNKQKGGAAVAVAVMAHREVDSAQYTKKAHEKVINAIAVAPNDKMFATASQDKTIKLWDAATGELQATLAGHRRGVWHVEFSPVERCLLSASADKTVKLWDVGQQMMCLKTLEGHTNSVLRASFLTHGMQVLSTSSDGTLKLWTIKTSECVNTFTAHEDRAWALAVRAEGAEIVTAGGDSLISVWHDCTAADQAAEQEAQQQTILKYVPAHATTT